MRFLADRLLEIAETVPEEIKNIKIDRDNNPLNDETIYDYKNYPQELYAKPVSYTHLRTHETVLDLVCRLLLEKKKYKPLHTHYNNNNSYNSI